LTGGDAEGAAALLNTVAAAGAPAPDPSTPLVVAFRGAALPAVQPVPPGWMLRLSVHVALDPDVRAVADAADAGQSARDEEPWFALVRDRQQRPLIRAASTERALVLDVAAPPDALLSAATVRAALSVREADTAARDEEVQPIADRQLGEWSRPPAAVDRDIWRSAEPSDARWCWAAALALLALETVVRRQRQHREEARAHAA
jgi:hypothetical protein